jgi:rhodanese-related sulfurtransferase
MQAMNAPPNDPIRAANYFLAKMSFTTGPVELDRRLREGEGLLVVVDVREADDYAKGHIPGAINLPKEQWPTADGLRKDATNVLYCYSHVCHLAASAAVEFGRRGFPVMEMDGGFDAWKGHEREIER